MRRGLTLCLELPATGLLWRRRLHRLASPTFSGPHAPSRSAPGFVHGKGEDGTKRFSARLCCSSSPRTSHGGLPGQELRLRLCS